jgi:hypothetical protein
VSPPTDPIEALIRVSKQLDDLRDRFAFLGGASSSLFVTEAGASSPRPTKDVDAIVQCRTYAEYSLLGDELRKRDFAVDTEKGAPTCRWVVKGTAIKVDLMPTDPQVLGLQGKWFDVAFRESTLLVVRNEELRVVSAPCFLATKLEAFHDRGKGDYLASHDLEDIIAVVDGRPELLGEVRQAPGSIQAYLGEKLRKLLSIDAFLDALPGHLGGDASSQARLRELTRRLRAIAGLE